MTATGSASRRRVRRNRITERDLVAVLIVAGFGAVGGMLADARPTAWRPADVLLTAALAGFVTWAGASAPWWILAGAAGVAMLVAAGPLWMAVALGAFVLAAVVGARRVSWPAARAISMALAINVLLRWDGPARFGVSALVTGLIVIVVVVAGLRRRGYSARRTVRRGMVVLAVAAGVALFGGAIAVAQAYGDLREGEQSLRAAASALRSGDIATAVEELERSSELLGDASGALDRPWAKPVLAVPLVSQHFATVADVARGANELTVQAATSVAQVDVESLRVINGVIDLAAIEVLETPFSATNASLRELDKVLRDARSPWLVAPLGDRIGELTTEVGELAAQTDRAIDAVRLAPPMLGRDGPRTYFVAFTTPAEARGLGGFMGSWAELRADGGRLEVIRTGTTIDLTSGMAADPPVLDGPPDYVTRYGRFGAGLDGDAVAVDFWSNYTMSPDFPSVTDVIAQLYPASGGQQIDGAIAVDVESVARFLELTGPIEVTGPDGPIRLTSANARDFLLRGQYADIGDETDGDAVLEELTTELVDAVFGGTLPGPRILAETIGPAMAEGRTSLWSFSPEDQLLLRALGISGELPAPSPDGLAVVSTNAGANKLDFYLRRNITYEAVVDEPSGELRATATIRLGNDAPASLPTSIGGNPYGLPPGTNRQYLSVYSPWQFVLAEVDGRSQGMESERELGWNVYSTYVDIPPGQEVEVRLSFAGRLPDDAEYGLTLRSQAMVLPDVVAIDVTTTDGRTLMSSHQPREGVVTLRSGAEPASS